MGVQPSALRAIKASVNQGPSSPTHGTNTRSSRGDTPPARTMQIVSSDALLWWVDRDIRAGTFKNAWGVVSEARTGSFSASQGAVSLVLNQ